MKEKFIKLYILVIIISLAIFPTTIQAASFGLSSNKKEVTVGESFTVTISGIYGKVKISGSNVQLSISGSTFIETGSLSITATTKSTGIATVTVTPQDAATTGANPQEVTGAKSVSVNVKEKEKEVEQVTPVKPQQTTPKKPTTTTTQAPTTNTEQPKTEDNFYINKIVLKGVKETEEKVDISLSPEFQKDIYEYTCNVAGDIHKLEIEKEAGNYTNSIIVTGLEELKEGENIITLQLSAEDHEAKTYTIKVIKEKQEVIETVAPVEENKEENFQKQEEKVKMISMPLWVFIIMQIFIIIIEVSIIYFIPWQQLWKNISHQ